MGLYIVGLCFVRTAAAGGKGWWGRWVDHSLAISTRRSGRRAAPSGGSRAYCAYHLAGGAAAARPPSTPLAARHERPSHHTGSCREPRPANPSLIRFLPPIPRVARFLAGATAQATLYDALKATKSLSLLKAAIDTVPEFVAATQDPNAAFTVFAPTNKGVTKTLEKLGGAYAWGPRNRDEPLASFSSAPLPVCQSAVGHVRARPSRQQSY